VGDYGTVLHYDGGSWSAMSSVTHNELWGVWGSSGSDVFAVGNLGTILHYDGGSWSPMSSSTTNPLDSVWGSGGSDVFVAGAGAILHGNHLFSSGFEMGGLATWSVVLP
jgi:hypothetical protein